MKQAIVLGGGIAGLAAAFELSKRFRVFVVEKDNELGGLLKSVSGHGYDIEEYYHVLFKGKDEFDGVQALCEELGLADKLEWGKGTTGFYYEKKLFRLSTPWDLFSYPLSTLEKARLVKAVVKFKLVRNALLYDDMTAEQWVEKNAGAGVFEKFFEPMLRAKFGKNTSEISAAWFIDRMKIRNKSRVTAEPIAYLAGGYKQLVDRLADRIRKNNGRIFLNTTAKLEVKNNQIVGAALSNGKKVKADCVVSTIPPQSLFKSVGLPEKFKASLEREYVSVVCVLVALKKPLTSFWWTNVVDKDSNFGAIVEHTNFRPASEYGEHLVYLASYPNEQVFSLPERKIFELYFSDLQRMFGVRKSDVNWYNVSKDRQAGVVYTRGMCRKISEQGVLTPIENLFVCGMFNTYPEARINSSIVKGKECARAALDREGYK